VYNKLVNKKNLSTTSNRCLGFVQNKNTILMLSPEKNKRNSTRDISFEPVTFPLAHYFVAGILVIECLSVIYPFNN
jgi:hypothetical protein